jgi:hypothetical protein
VLTPSMDLPSLFRRALGLSFACAVDGGAMRSMSASGRSCVRPRRFVTDGLPGLTQSEEMSSPHREIHRLAAEIQDRSASQPLSLSANGRKETDGCKSARKVANGA